MHRFSWYSLSINFWKTPPSLITERVMQCWVLAVKAPALADIKVSWGSRGLGGSMVGGRETGQGSSLDKGTGPRLHATQELSPCLILY